MTLPVAKKVTLKEVPIIDLAAMHGNDPAARLALAKDMGQACADLGFFYIVNHGVPADSRNRLFELAHTFFALPAECLQKLEQSKATHYRGYIPIKAMTQSPTFKGSKDELKGNLYEAFQIHAEYPDDDPDLLAGKPLHAPNPWPSEIPELREGMLAYFSEALVLGRKMSKLFALALDLPENALEQYFTRPMSQLRFIHYPPQPANDPGENIGLRPHTDSGGFTILAQDNVGGLEVLTRSQEWIQVPPLENSYVINLGEMMKIWTDGVFQATPHRVVNRYGKERYSIPFFMTPNFDARISPLVTNPQPSQAPTFATTVSGSGKTCGEIMVPLYDRIWPVKPKEVA